MIKINLLGEEVKADRSGTLFLVGFGASVLALLAIFFYLNSTIAGEIADRDSQVKSLEAQLAKLKNTTKEVRELEAKRAQLRNKLAVIATLKRNKTGPVRAMDDLDAALPERAWISEIREATEGNFRIMGRALDNQTVAEFMTGLSKSDYFRDVELIEAKQGVWNGARINEFILQAKVNYAGRVLAAPTAAPTPQAPS